MPGNQGTSDGEVELKVSYMVKRSQGKSAIGSTNFKKRVFVLTPSRLSYFEGTLEVSGDGHYYSVRTLSSGSIQAQTPSTFMADL